MWLKEKIDETEHVYVKMRECDIEGVKMEKTLKILKHIESKAYVLGYTLSQMKLILWEYNANV